MVLDTTTETVDIIEIKKGNQHGKPRTEKQQAADLRNISKGTKFMPDVIVADFNTTSRIEYVALSRLRVDSSYQRNPDKTRISIMAHNWDQDKVGLLVVNRRPDGYFYIIDGQQRFAAINRIKNKPDTLMAQVFNGLTVEQEAKLFYELDTKRASLTRGALFTALVTAKDPAAMEIIEAANEVGLTADYHRGAVTNNLRSFGALMEVHRRVGKDDLARILRIVAKAWPDSKHTGTGSVILGLEKFFQKYPKANETHLIEALSRTTVKKIDNNARSLNSTFSGALGQWTARVIHNIYNHGMKTNRLPSWD